MNDELQALLNDPLNADPQKLMAAMQGVGEPNPFESESGVTNAPPSVDDKAAAAPEVKVEEKEPEQPAKEPDPEAVDPEKAVIKTKDGKHEIPYAVLQKARERESALESQLRDLNSQLAALQAQAQGSGERVEDVDPLDAETMASLEEEAPTLARAFKGLQSEIARLKEANAQIATREATRTRDTVQEAIDAVPKLAHVQSSNVDTYNEIVEIDQILRANPKYQGVALQERFAKAVSMWEAANGPIALPGASATPAAPPVDPEAIKAKAEKVIEQAALAARPSTLSDLPGGQPPAASELEAVTGESAAALTQRFLSMTPQQITEYLARLG